MEQSAADAGDLTRAPVVIVGGGPVGLATALGLAHHGVRSLVLEHDLRAPRGSRAFGIWGRTLELLEDWGLERAFLDDGDRRMAVAPHDIHRDRSIFRIDFSHLADESAMPGLLLLPQSETERLLREAIAAEPLATVMEATCTGFTQDAHGVTVRAHTADGDIQIAAEYLVGADGSRSTVREALGMRHAGSIITVDLVVFDVQVEDAGLDPIRLDPRRHGLRAALKFASGSWRVLVSLPGKPVPEERPEEGPPPRKPDLPLDELYPHVRALFGDRAAHITWQSQTTLYQQRIDRYRVGRVVLAGDAAHLISPAGGQGMNQGLQDAENLAFSLASALRGRDPDEALDGYDAERRSVAIAVARRAWLNSLLEFRTPVWSRRFAFAAFRLILGIRPIHRLIVRRLSMRDLAYRRGVSARLSGHSRALGRRVPDMVLGSGERLADRMAGGVAVLALAGAKVPAVPDGVPVVFLDRSPRGVRLSGGRLAIVRPDRHVGGVLKNPSERQLRDALERAGWAPLP